MVWDWGFVIVLVAGFEEFISVCISSDPLSDVLSVACFPVVLLRPML